MAVSVFILHYRTCQICFEHKVEYNVHREKDVNVPHLLSKIGLWLFANYCINEIRQFSTDSNLSMYHREKAILIFSNIFIQVCVNLLEKDLVRLFMSAQKLFSTSFNLIITFIQLLMIIQVSFFFLFLFLCYTLSKLLFEDWYLVCDFCLARAVKWHIKFLNRI